MDLNRRGNANSSTEEKIKNRIHRALFPQVLFQRGFGQIVVMAKDSTDRE